MSRHTQTFERFFVNDTQLNSQFLSPCFFLCKKFNSLIFQVCIIVWLFCIVNKYKQSNEILEKPLLEALAATWHFYAGCCIHNDNQTTRFNISCNFFTASLLNIYRNHCELHSNIIYKYIGIQTLRKRQTRKKRDNKKNLLLSWLLTHFYLI